MKTLLLDIEANGLASPTLIHCIVCKDVDTGEWFKFRPRSPLGGHHEWGESFLDFVKDYDLFIGHNIIGYDRLVIKDLLGLDIPIEKIVDTLVLSRLFRPVSSENGFCKEKGHDNRVGGHSLEAWGKRLGELKGEFNEWEVFSERMLEYCVQDVNVLEKIYKHLMDVESIGFSEESIRLEHEVAACLKQMEINGFYLDKDKASKMKADTQLLITEALDILKELFPPKKKQISIYTPRYTKDGVLNKVSQRIINNPLAEKNADGTYTLYAIEEFNPGSPNQVVDRLLSLGWTPTKLTPAGKPSADKESIAAAIESLAHVPAVKALGKYNILVNRHEKVSKWLELVEQDGRVHGHINPVGAGTHRCSHFNDNMANIAKVVTDKMSLAVFVEKYGSVDKFTKFQKFDEDRLFLHADSPDSPGAKVEYALCGIDGGFGWESRDCWGTSSEDTCIVGADASGIQLRALAHYMNDPVYIDKLLNADIHVVNQQAAGLPSRSKAKTFCVPMNTEILTASGWKHRVDIKEGDKVLSLNPSSGLIEEDKILLVHDYENSDTFSYEMNGWRFRCTEDHRWYGSKRNTNRGKRDFTSTFFTLEDTGEFKLQVAAPSSFSNGLSIADKDVELLTWLITDGWWKWADVSRRKNDRAVDSWITQSKRKYYAEIKEKFSDLFVGEYAATQTDCVNFRVKPAHLRAVLGRIGATGKSKYEIDWVSFILNITPAQRKIFLDIFFKAEGWLCEGKTRSVCQKDKNITDAVVLAGTLSGYDTRCHKQKSGIYVIRLKEKSTIRANNLRKTSHTVCNTWCVTTGNGTWIARQGNVVTITGNCYAWIMGAGDEKIGGIVGVHPEEQEELFTWARTFYARNYHSKEKDKQNLLAFTVSSLRNKGLKASKKLVATVLKGKQTKGKFLDSLPELKRFKTKDIPAAAKRGYLIGLDGRKVWVPSEHLAMPAYLQSFEAIVMKKVIILTHKKLVELNIPFKLCAFVHDELQIECKKEHADTVGKTVVWAIQEAGRLLGSNCPLDGEYKVGRSWAETH